jgi:adenylate cyclase
MSVDPPIVLKIALNSGAATTGDIGPPTRPEYTVLGEVVNTCARLVSVCAAGQILLTAATRDRLHSAGGLRPLDPITVSGRDGLIELFEAETDSREVQVRTTEQRTAQQNQ